MTDESPVDRKVLDDLKTLDAPGKPSIVKRLVRIFIDESSRRLQRMKDSLESSDFETFAREAHSFKSAAGTVGATPLRRLCLEIEKCEVTEKRTELLPLLEKEFHRVKIELESIILALPHG